MQETWVRSLGWDDPLEKGKATHSSILTWQIPGLQRIRHNFHFGKGNGNPLQYSCLENPMDGGAWWATDHGVAKSRPRLSDFSSLPFMLLYCCQPSSYIVLTCVLVSQHLWQAE